MLTIAVLSLAALLLRSAYEFPIVFNAVEDQMLWYQKISGLWSAQGSSLMFWCFLMSAVISITVRLSRDDEMPQRPAISLLILNATQLFFLIPTIFFTNPFEKFWALQNGSMVNAVFAPMGASLVVPLDGAGMNPALRHIAMLLHPPFLYAGFLGFFIPYAMALASLLAYDQDQKWIRKTYPIALGAWVCLTAGMFLGSWWAYTILGWGGYWGWDAVEISGLLPWLLTFGMIHSMTMFLHKRIFLMWAYILTALIVLFILFGILLTRSGIIESVHAYTTGGMGPVLTGLIILYAALWIFLIIKNKAGIKTIHAPGKPEFSDRLTAGFNWIVITLVLIIWAGQTLPVTSKLLAGKQISLDPSHYELATSPLFLGLLIVTALFPISLQWNPHQKRFWVEAALSGIFATIVPIVLSHYHPLAIWPQIGFWAVSFLVLIWGKESVALLVSSAKGKMVFQGPSASIHHKASTCLIHLGFAILACSILTVEQFTTHQEVCMETGDQVRAGNLMITASAREEGNLQSSVSKNALSISISSVGSKTRTITPSLSYYAKQEVLHGQPAIHSTLLRDVYVVLNEWRAAPEGCAKISISILPLINWIWIGGIAMAAGGVMQLIWLRSGRSSSLPRH